MISDYTKEVGLPSQKKTLSRPVALIVLALVGVGISFGVAEVIAQTREFHEAEKKAQPTASTAPAGEPAGVPTPTESK